MKYFSLNFFLILFLSAVAVSGQQVAVSCYLQQSDPRLEWTELIVLSDNVDMRGWTIRDNNSGQTAWQTPVTFLNIPYWNNMRRGTIIMLWHRTVDLSAVAHPVDVDKSDGYIELDAKNAAYFSGGDFEAGLNTTLNLAAAGDIVELRNSSGVHVSALAHLTTPGTSWTVMSSPKLNHNQGTSNGDAIYVCPGSVTADYGTNTPQSGNTYTTRNNSSLTFGIPNTCNLWPNNNRTLWRSLREPDMSAQTVTPSSVVAGNPGSITFSWVAATDPNPSDNTTGYIVLRNTSNSFAAPPSDGLIYTTGNTIGGATLVGEILNSATTTFTDNTVMNGSSYYYRVYAFRYGADNMTGTGFPLADNARARAYNETNYVQVNWPFTNPLPINLLFFNALPSNQKVKLTWETSSELNNNFFTVERSADAISFEQIGVAAGQGNSTVLHAYETEDEKPLTGISYYRLRQTDFDGSSTLSRTVAVQFKCKAQFNCSIFPNPFREKILMTVSSSASGSIRIYLTDAAGKIVREENRTLNAGSSAYELSTNDLERGIYFLTIQSEDNIFHQRVVRD